MHCCCLLFTDIRLTYLFIAVFTANVAAAAIITIVVVAVAIDVITVVIDVVVFGAVATSILFIKLLRYLF